MTWKAITTDTHMTPIGRIEARLVPGTVTLPLHSRNECQSVLDNVIAGLRRLNNGMIPFWQPDTGVAKMPSTEPTAQRSADQLTRALDEAVIRIWSNLPQDVQNHLYREAVRSQGESIRSQLADFLHDKHRRTLDPLGRPREMTEPDSLGG